MDIMIGADPEVFVKGPDGRNISGHDMIPGTKRRPYQVQDGAVQVDGTALEFNITPAKTEDEFVRYVNSVMGQLKGMIPAGCSLDLSAVARYEEDYFALLPKAVKALGCDPDFNAYSGVEQERKGKNWPMRTAAGHIHIGWTDGHDPFETRHYQSCRTLAKELDCWLGLPSVLFDPDSHPRRQMYGQAGSFRPKPYGCEYRVLSNKWLQDEKLMRWVYSTTQFAFNYLMGGNMPQHENLRGHSVQQLINESRSEQIRAVLAHYGIGMPEGYEHMLPVKEQPKSILKQKTMEKVLFKMDPHGGDMAVINPADVQRILEDMAAEPAPARRR